MAMTMMMTTIQMMMSCSSDEDEEDEYSDLPEDAVNAIHFFKDSILQLREQTHKLDHEYEKLAEVT